MGRDLLDDQNQVRERVRWIEVGPWQHQSKYPDPWDPAYDLLDEISLVAYAMLPFTAYWLPSLPAIPPDAQYVAIEMWNRGYPSMNASRAFMRAMLCCGGILLPFRFSSFGAGGLVQRMEGAYTDNTGEHWRQQPNSRFVAWDFAGGQAYPPPDPAPPPDTDTNKYEWRLGPPAGLPLLAPSEYNQPLGPAFLGSPYSEGYYTYWASTLGQRLQTISAGTAGYLTGPENDIRVACETNQYQESGWMLPDDGPTGMYNRSHKTAEPLCFENPFGFTETGMWNMGAYDLDALSGCYWPVPPRYYQGEPHMAFTRSADGLMITWPGFDIWRDRVEEWCFGTPDWISNMLPWYRSNRPRLSVTGTPSQHWQRAPVHLPWLGRLEYRIWQRVLYLRGTLYNPFDWFNTPDIMPLPPGVTPVNPNPHIRVMGSDSKPYALEYEPEPDRLIVDRTDLGPGASRGDTPIELILDGAALPINHNEPYVP